MRSVLCKVACRRRAFGRRLTKLVDMLACSSHSVLVAAYITRDRHVVNSTMTWRRGDRVRTLFWKKHPPSSMARKDGVETTSTTLPCQYDNSLRCPGPAAPWKLGSCTRSTPLAMRYRLPINDRTNVKTIARTYNDECAYMRTVLKQLYSHRSTIVETKRNVNFLLASTVHS